MKVLEKYEEYLDWDKLAEHCDSIEGLSGLEKERAKRAFKFLKEALGENLLKESRPRHPLIPHILNLAPWSRKWISWLAEALEELQERNGYQSLLERLRRTDGFSEGLSVLEVADKLSKSGFEVVFDPVVDVSGQTKRPDLRLLDRETGETVYVEVSVLEESRVARDASRTMTKIFDPLWRVVPFLNYSGVIHKSLSERHLEEVAQKVVATVEKVRKTGAFQYLAIEDVLELGIAPDNDKDLLEKWATERGLHIGELSGPRFDVDEVLRTRRKIEREQDQLPKEHPNLLVIKSTNLFLMVRDRRRAIAELEESVYEFPHLLAAIVSGDHLGKAETDIMMKGQHVVITKPRLDLLVEYHMILLNKFCHTKVSASVITKIYNSFRTY